MKIKKYKKSEKGFIVVLMTLTLKTIIMGDIIWLIVVLLIIGWLVGYFAFPDIGSIIHILLVIAVIAIIWRLATGRRL